MPEIATLGDICKMYQPKTISTKEMSDEGQYTVFGANGVIGKYNKYNHEEPQLLLTCRGATCGEVNISEPFSWINGNAMVIQPDLNKVSFRFMEYLLKGGISLSKAITGAAQPQITRQSLLPIKFSFPPLPEQKRIVAKLDKAFAEIDTLEQSKEQKKGLVEIIFKQYSSVLFNQPSFISNKIGDICSLTTGGTPRTSDKSNYDMEQYHGLFRVTFIREKFLKQKKKFHKKDWKAQMLDI